MTITANNQTPQHQWHIIFWLVKCVPTASCKCKCRTQVHEDRYFSSARFYIHTYYEEVLNSAYDLHYAYFIFCCFCCSTAIMYFFINMSYIELDIHCWISLKIRTQMPKSATFCHSHSIGDFRKLLIQFHIIKQDKPVKRARCNNPLKFED